MAKPARKDRAWLYVTPALRDRMKVAAAERQLSLMYRMVDFIAPTFGDLLGWAGVQPDLAYAGWHRQGGDDTPIERNE